MKSRMMHCFRERRIMRFRRFGRKKCGMNTDRGNSDVICPGENKINMTQLKNGQTATVIAVLGHGKQVSRLNAMGIIPGAEIVKKSSSVMKGPVVIEKSGIHLAVGFHMAQHIIVEPSDGIKTEEKDRGPA